MFAGPFLQIAVCLWPGDPRSTHSPGDRVHPHKRQTEAEQCRSSGWILQVERILNDHLEMIASNISIYQGWDRVGSATCSLFSFLQSWYVEMSSRLFYKQYFEIGAYSTKPEWFVLKFRDQLLSSFGTNHLPPLSMLPNYFWENLFYRNFREIIHF